LPKSYNRMPKSYNCGKYTYISQKTFLKTIEKFHKIFRKNTKRCLILNVLIFNSIKKRQFVSNFILLRINKMKKIFRKKSKKTKRIKQKRKKVAAKKEKSLEVYSCKHLVYTCSILLSKMNDKFKPNLS